MTEFTLSTGDPVPLKPAPVKTFRGLRLPGAELQHADQGNYVVSIHDFALSLFRFSLRHFYCSVGQTFFIRENSKYLRLETVLTGELSIRDRDGTDMKLLAGQYRISDSNICQLYFKSQQGCQYFVTFISPELLSQTPLSGSIIPSGPLTMSTPMREVIYRILDNPFEEKFRDALYDYSVRELLFYHVTAPPFNLPGELTPSELAAVQAADQIIASNLHTHYSIQELAKMTRTNAQVLKTGFARLYGMGTFERLLQRKMDRATFLLETTDKQVQVVSELSGYETVTGFINAFRKQFKMTPKDWRKKSRGRLQG